MRKNRLIEEMNRVIEKNNSLYSKCQELQALLDEKNIQVAELTASIAEVNAVNDLLKAELQLKSAALDEMSAVTATVTYKTVDTADTVAESVAEDREAVLPETQQKDALPILEPVMASTALIAEEKINAASKAIGRVVLQCAELCNSFASIGNVNSKDLINLALGRTEVFKSEVLQLATEGNSAEGIASDLEDKEKSVLEYFELLKSQI